MRVIRQRDRDHLARLRIVDRACQHHLVVEGHCLIDHGGHSQAVQRGHVQAWRCLVDGELAQHRVGRVASDIGRHDREQVLAFRQRRHIGLQRRRRLVPGDSLGLARGIFQAERQLGRRIVQGVTQHQGRDLGGGQPRVGQCKGQSRCGLVDGEGFVGAEGRSVASEVGLLKRDIVLALA